MASRRKRSKASIPSSSTAKGSSSAFVVVPLLFFVVRDFRGRGATLLFFVVRDLRGRGATLQLLARAYWKQDTTLAHTHGLKVWYTSEA